MRKLNFLLLAFSFLVSCSSSNKTTGDAAPVKSFSKLFIEVATVDVQVRKDLETAIASAIVAEGGSVVKSLDVIPFSMKELKLPAKEEIELKVKENGCDGILIVSLSKKGEAIDYTPGISKKANTQFLASVLGDILRKGNYANPEPADIKAVDIPGSYSRSSARFILQGNLYDADSQEIIFANQSEDIDINTVGKTGNEYAAGLIALLKKEKLLTRK